MKRLTRRTCGGLGVIKGCELDTIAGAKAVVNRLADYEDTGLEPGELSMMLGLVSDHSSADMDFLSACVDAARCGLTTDRLRCLVQVEKNDPLTLDDLWRMYDEEEGSVWVRFGRVCWPAILDIYDGELVAVWSAKSKLLQEKDYGKTWLAYRRKPEKGTE